MSLRLRHTAKLPLLLLLLLLSFAHTSRHVQAFVVSSAVSASRTRAVSSPTILRFRPSDGVPHKQGRLMLARSSSAPNRRPRQNHEKWQPYFDKLVEYKEKNGHCQVPLDEAPLGPWLEEQIHSYKLLHSGKKTKLTKKRAVALERLGAIPADVLDEL